jgi:hypothetical protein
MGTVTHGMTHTRTFRCWLAMRWRCQCRTNSQYLRYGGAGITVCERWQIFENFLADMGEAPTDKHTLDRYPNQKGSYEPGNVRWATSKEQARNTSANRLITAFSETKPLTEWAEDHRCSISANLLFARINAGWSAEVAITTPGRRKRSLTPEQAADIFRRIENGDSNRAIARALGISNGMVSDMRTGKRKLPHLRGREAEHAPA